METWAFFCSRVWIWSFLGMYCSKRVERVKEQEAMANSEATTTSATTLPRRATLTAACARSRWTTSRQATRFVPPCIFKCALPHTIAELRAHAHTYTRNETRLQPSLAHALLASKRSLPSTPPPPLAYSQKRAAASPLTPACRPPAPRKRSTWKWMIPETWRETTIVLWASFDVLSNSPCTIISVNSEIRRITFIFLGSGITFIREWLKIHLAEWKQLRITTADYNKKENK